LNVFPIEVPPLRSRCADIPLLVWRFVQEFNARMGRSIDSIPKPMMERLKQYPWPGNVRELRNVIERGVLTGRGPLLELGNILPEASPAKAQDAAPAPGSGVPALTVSGFDLPAAMKAIEKNYIDEALRLSGGNESEAARLLNLNYYTIRHRRKKLYEE
jgi:transcriptional regulator with GAF, ATPase, and Fis domain